ncbi:MAG: hypothetical protein JW863_15720 [Chitinispirillaceae bacterium]|nr:hypothetical protein [Chitinispirillaceae bacterium]
MYGVKSFFKTRDDEWQLVAAPESENTAVLDRLRMKHVKEDPYMFADTYDGEKIKQCIEDFLKASNVQMPVEVSSQSRTLAFGGNADLIAYVGHDGLMDFNVSLQYSSTVEKTKEVIILACYSKSYFSPEIRKAKANPTLWTTRLMAPEAYTLQAALDGWIRNETGKEINERAAQIYQKYQKCGINGARKLFAIGY